MRTEITLKQAVGRTLEGAYLSSIFPSLVLTFSGNVFTHVSANADPYELGNARMHNSPLQWSEFDNGKLVELSVFSQEELDAKIQHQKAVHAARVDERNRADYERLKAI